MLTLTRWPYPKIIAHRGCGSLAPENTLVALRLAASLGFAGVEVDTQLAADGVPVLMHDDTLDRTTTGTGPLSDHTSRILHGLDAGIWYGNEFAGEPVPTLEAACMLCRASRQWMNIEIKAEGDAAAPTGHAVAVLVGRLWKSAVPVPLLSSFSDEALAAAREAAPEIPRGLLVDTLDAVAIERARALACQAVHAGHDGLTADAIDAAHAASLGVLAWTVNDSARAAALFRWGLDALVTDELRDIGPDFLSHATAA